MTDPLKVSDPLPPAGNRELPSTPAATTMTFDEFFAEAERTGLTIGALVPALNGRLADMEDQGVIVKHADGGHAWAPGHAADEISAGTGPSKQHRAIVDNTGSDADIRRMLELRGQLRLVD